MANKKCTYCGELKNMNEFYMDSRKPGRRQSRCKECLRGLSLDNYRQKKLSGFLKVKSHVKAYSSSRECSKCRKLKPNDEYHKDASTKTGVRATCKTCINSKGSFIYLRDKEKYKEHRRAASKNYYLRNKNRLCIYKRQKERKEIEDLSDRYIKKLISRRHVKNNMLVTIKASDIPDVLVDVKRLQLSIIRKLKEVNYEKHD